MPKRPALVGAAEAAEILGVRTLQVSRWRKAGRMPCVVALLASTPVWLRSDVVAMKDGRTLHPHRRPLPLAGLGEVAERLGRDKSQIGRWRRAGKFPEPAADLLAGPIWYLADVASFEDARAA